MSGSSHRNRRLLIAGTAALAALAIVLPVVGVLMAPHNDRQSATSTSTTTTTKPVLTIKPLSVRPVIDALVTTPDQCPPPAPTPPNQPLRTCDIAQAAVYDLGPEEVQLQLTDVDSFKSPLTNGYTVQMTMTSESPQDFARFTRIRPRHAASGRSGRTARP